MVSQSFFVRKSVTNGSSHILPWANDSGAGGCRREATRIVWTIDQAPLSLWYSIPAFRIFPWGILYQQTDHSSWSTPGHLPLGHPDSFPEDWSLALYHCEKLLLRLYLACSPSGIAVECGWNSYMLIQWEGRIPGNAMGTVASHYSCNLTLEWCSVGLGRGGFRVGVQLTLRYL